jgi:beta-lactamase regulating signal transducer with metallopeptidase domain
MMQAASTYEPLTYKTNLLEDFFRIGSVIWSIIAVAAMLAMMIMYYLTKTELRKATHLRDNVYSSRLVDTPTVYGIIKPKIVLPDGVEKEQLVYILAHERVHIRRHDNIWRMLAILTACVHWFNPLIWWFLKAFLTDTELACDTAAVKRMKEEERKNYAKTLLAFASREKTVFASAFGSSKVRVRIENILTYRKLTLISTISFVGMGLMIAYLLLTNAAVIK